MKNMILALSATVLLTSGCAEKVKCTKVQKREYYIVKVPKKTTIKVCDTNNSLVKDMAKVNSDLRLGMKFYEKQTRELIKRVK